MCYFRPLKIATLVFILIFASLVESSRKRWNKKGNGMTRGIGGGWRKRNGRTGGEGGAAVNGIQGKCSSDSDCSIDTPVCSEYGYCQCTSYKPGDPECWQQIGTGGGGNIGGNGGSSGGGGGGNLKQKNCGSDSDCPVNTPICSEYGYCQCASYKPGDPECWQQGGKVGGGGGGGSRGNGSGSKGRGIGGSKEGSGIGSKGRSIGGSKEGSVGGSYEGDDGTGSGGDKGGGHSGRQGNCGSDSDCLAATPVCSEYGYCQCASYKPGDPECWQQGGLGGGGGVGGQGNCVADSDCPSNAPVCSEYGYCQCASYKPGDPECWQEG